jgi:hypothetical protein
MLFLSRKSLVVTAVAVACALSLVSCKGFFVDPTLSSIALGPASPQVAVGSTLQMQAIGTYSDNTTKDITSKVTWTTANNSNNQFFSINNAGLLKGVAATSATPLPSLTASLGAITSPSQTVTVTAATLQSITIQPPASSLSIASTGGKYQFTCTGSYSDGSNPTITNQVTWSSDTVTVASFPAANSIGQASLLAAGTAKITATAGAVSQTITITVTN